MSESRLPPSSRAAAPADAGFAPADAVRNDPRYAETANRFGHERASFLATHYGAEALSDAFQRTTPIELDHSKEVLARLDLFNRMASQMEDRPLAEVQRRADAKWDKLRRDNQDENSATIWMRMPPRGYRKKGVARL